MYMCIPTFILCMCASPPLSYVYVYISTFILCVCMQPYLYPMCMYTCLLFAVSQQFRFVRSKKMNFLSVFSPAELGLGVSGLCQNSVGIEVLQSLCSCSHMGWEQCMRGCRGGQICIAVSMISIRLCQGWALWQVQLWLLWSSTPHLPVPFLISGLSKSHSLIHENSFSGFSEWLKGNNSFMSSQYRWMPFVWWGKASILSTKSLVN